MLLELIAQIKGETKKIHEETAVIQENQRKFLVDIENFNKRQSKLNSTKGKDIDKYKSQTMKLADQISHLSLSNEALKKDIKTENELLEELEEIVYKMKNEINLQTEVCDKLRKDVIVKSKKCEQLEQKAANIVKYSLIL